MSQKLEDLLNLALETPEGIREQTESLNVGFDSVNRSWELIVKYHGDIQGLSALGITVETLIAGYAVLTVPEELVETVASLEEIEYVEKPKRYYYETGELRACVNQEIGTASCILPVTLREPYLTGEGILLAVLDSGIDYRRPEFRFADGSTRILALWDQTLRPSAKDTTRTVGAEETGNGDSGQDSNPLRLPPEGFAMGVEFDREQINAALSQENNGTAYNSVPSIDTSGHGTAVAGIAAASSLYKSTDPFAAPSTYEGVAPGCSLLIVKLGLPGESGFPRTTEIMRGVTYALRKALSLNMPLVINLSFGNSYGSHDGSSLLERFLDNASEIGRTVICVGSGNEGASSGHAAGNVSSGRQVDLAVANYERNLSIQLWKHYSDRYRITLRSPGGVIRQLPDTLSPEKTTFRMEQTDLLVYLGEPTPYSVNQEIYFELLPTAGAYINSGIWQITIDPIQTVTGQYYLYLPGSAVRSTGTGFTNPTPQVTLTIPSTAAKVITVGAYDSTFDSYADFSGRGYSDPVRTIGVVTAGLTKPDIAAPGVNVPAPDLYGGFSFFTGTSFATPIVSGCAALLMEWGIEKGNDPYLYGEKLKAYFRSGAKPIRGEEIYPNDRVGFGALCLADSLPQGS